MGGGGYRLEGFVVPLGTVMKTKFGINCENMLSDYNQKLTGILYKRTR